MKPEHGKGVIEWERPDWTSTTRKAIRHRRTRGDSWSMGIACSTDMIALPFDDVDVALCPDCWPER